MKLKHKNNLKCYYKRKRFEIGFAKMKSKIKLRIKANVKANLAATGFFRRDTEFGEQIFEKFVLKTFHKVFELFREPTSWLRHGEVRRLKLTVNGSAQIATKRLKVNSLNVGSAGGKEKKHNTSLDRSADSLLLNLFGAPFFRNYSETLKLFAVSVV